MAIAPALLIANQSGTDANSYTTASFTPTANCLVLAAVASQTSSGTPGLPGLTGNGLTWVSVGSSSTSGRRSTVLRALGAAPSAGTNVIDFAGVTQTRCVWSFIEFSGVDTSGTNGSGAVVQFKVAAGTGTSGTADFDAAFGDGTNNATYSALFKNSTSNTAVEAGFTELSETATETAASLQVMWRLGEDQTPAPTWTPSAAWHQIAIEIKAASAVTKPPRPTVVNFAVTRASSY